MKKNIMIVLLMVFVTPFLSGVSLAILTPVADGHYSDYAEGCFGIYSACDHWGSVSIESGITIRVFWDMGPGGICDECGSYNFREGIIEFDISGLDGLFTSGQIEAVLSLTVQDGYLPDVNCLSLYNIQDVNENGVIEEVDIDTEDFTGEVCEDLQPGDIITFDVTTAIEHDLYDPDQTDFSGFILRSSGWLGVDSIIEFYDHTNPTYAPRLSISDGDGIPDEEDNCPNDYNPLQEDTYPPQGNGIGDACDCECDFDCSGSVDATDVSAFLADFGRNEFNDPCTIGIPCNGDINCDSNVEATDVTKFLEDFGRNQFNNQCPACVVGDWCTYTRFTDNGDGTVTDNYHGLVWLKEAHCSELNPFGVYYTWGEAMQGATSLSNGDCGLTDGSSAGDWRLPTQVEWDAFTCTQYLNPAICDTSGHAQWTQDNPFTCCDGSSLEIQDLRLWTSTLEDIWLSYVGRVDDGSKYLGGHSLYLHVWPLRDP